MTGFPNTTIRSWIAAFVLALLVGTAVSSSPVAAADASQRVMSSDAVETGLGLTREDRRAIQRALSAAGLRPGQPDGLFGRRTRAAIAEWQKARGEKPTGYLDADGVKALLADESEPEAPERVEGGSKGSAPPPQAVSAAPPTFAEASAAYTRGDYAEALKGFRVHAEQGDAKAQSNLGTMYGQGRGVARDNAEALRWFRLAAEQGDAKAQTNLGTMYVQGWGVARDYTEAVRWLRLAAEQGHAKAQANLGAMYVQGWGVARDNAEALRWFRLAAEQGHATAQANLGTMYNQGRGVARDYTEAKRWFRLAAEQGHAPAQYNLGVMYEKGRGVSRDDAEAVRWFRLAAEQGVANAKKALKRRGL